MAVQQISMSCPNCHGQIQLPPGKRSCFCPYCGTQVLLDDGSVTVTHRTIDDAKVKAVETDGIIRLEQLRMAKRRRKTLLVAAVVLGAIALVTFLIYAVTSNDSFIMIGLWAIVGLMFLVLVAMYMAKNSDNNIPLAQGEARCPMDPDDARGKNYEAVASQFRAAGFEDVQAFGLGDITFFNKAFVKEGSVESMTIDEKESFGQGKIYPRGARVRIRYHSR